MDDEARMVTPVSAPPASIHMAWFMVVALLVVLVDQVSKWAISTLLSPGERLPDGWPVRLVYVTNTGAAFGIFQGAGFLLALASIVGVAAILIYLLSPGFAHPLLRLGLALMLGGAAGNLIDRVRAGEVVDFLKVTGWPAFNVADSAITIGVLVLLWVMLATSKSSGAS